MNETTQQRTPTPQPPGLDGPEHADPGRRLWGLWRQGQQPRVADFLEQAGVRDPELIVMALRVDQTERCRLGQWVPAEDYLDAFPAVRDHAESTVDLVFAEFLLREERGERPPLEEFLRRFPEHADELKLQIGLHREMDAECAPPATRAGIAETLPVGSRSAPADVPSTYPEIHGYEVMDVLGRGGMGIVYRAWQAELKRTVALKMLIAGSQASPEAAARFRVEVEAMARLRHPNIVQIHGVGQHAGAPYLVLELVEGRSLAQTLAGTPQPAEWSARTMEALARAIHSAHLLGVVHRDLSPANVLMAADGTPKVTDFGLAKLLIGGGSMRTNTGDLLGTPSYMAPEQAGSLDGTIGPATDVYALGAILYEMLTGRPPFKAERPLETLRQVIHEEPVTPSRLRPRLPQDLETICLKCLHKEPGRRYASALALAEELRRYLEGRPIEARRSTRAERSWRWCRRNPGLAAASITAASLLTIVAIGSTLAAWKFRRDSLRIQDAERATGANLLDSRMNLFESLVAQAQARRFSHREGQRFASLDALDRASKIARELNLTPDHFDRLRHEAIACMALPDLRATGRVIHRPPGVHFVAFDRTMTRYALRFRDGTIRIHRVADGAEIDRFAALGDSAIWVLFQFSPDGRYLATRHSPGWALTVRDVDRRTVALDAPGPVGRFVARFSPDSRRLALCREDGGTLIYDLATGQPGGSWNGPASGQDLAFGADGTRIATLHNEPGTSTCRIVESDSGRLLMAIPLPSAGEHVWWSPDGRTLATSCVDFKIYLWDAVTGRRKAVLEGLTNHVFLVDFHPSGALLVSNGWENRLRLWDPILGRPLLSLTADMSSARPEFSRDGRIVVTHEDALTTYEVDPALEYRTLAHPSGEPRFLGRASIRHDGRVLAVSTSGGVALWDLARGTELASLRIGFTGYALFESSGDLLTLSEDAGGIHRWPVHLDPDRGEFRIGPPRRLPLPAGGRGGLAEDGSGRIVARGESGVAHVLTPAGTFDVGPLVDCRYVALSPDGEWLATASQARGAQLWRIRGAAADKVAELPVDHGTPVDFSPDGKWLITQTSPCRLWEPATGRLVRQIGGYGLCFSPDGRLLAVQDADKVFRLVEAETDRTVARLESPDLSSVESAVFTPDGSRLVVTTREGPAVHVWDLRAIRRKLAGMRLDWEAPSFPEVDTAAGAGPPPPLTAVVDLGGLDAEGRLLLQQGRDLQAVGKTGEAIDVLRRAVGQSPDLAEARNDLAWLLATTPGPLRNAPEAVAHARRATELVPDESMYLNTYGVALHRAGRFAEAVPVLGRSLGAGRGQSDAFDLFFLATAHHRLSHREEARGCFDRAVRWVAAQKDLNAERTGELARFRAEAEAVLAGPCGELPDDVFAPSRPAK
jgi:serine/threonine protein kinase/WD40 repeat protein